MTDANLKPKRRCATVTPEHATQKLEQPAATVVRAKQVQDARKAFGSLTRNLHRLGLYEKLRGLLSQIEQEIK